MHLNVIRESLSSYPRSNSKVPGGRVAGRAKQRRQSVEVLVVEVVGEGVEEVGVGGGRRRVAIVGVDLHHAADGDADAHGQSGGGCGVLGVHLPRRVVAPVHRRRGGVVHLLDPLMELGGIYWKEMEEEEDWSTGIYWKETEECVVSAQCRAEREQKKPSLLCLLRKNGPISNRAIA